MYLKKNIVLKEKISSFFGGRRPKNDFFFIENDNGGPVRNRGFGLF